MAWIWDPDISIPYFFLCFKPRRPWNPQVRIFRDWITLNPHSSRYPLISMALERLQRLERARAMPMIASLVFLLSSLAQRNGGPFRKHGGLNSISSGKMVLVYYFFIHCNDSFLLLKRFTLAEVVLWSARMSRRPLHMLVVESGRCPVVISATQLLWVGLSNKIPGCIRISPIQPQ